VNVAALTRLHFLQLDDAPEGAAAAAPPSSRRSLPSFYKSPDPSFLCGTQSKAERLLQPMEIDMKKFWNKTTNARAVALKTMKACLLVAVAIISGCLIVAYLGETIIAVGLWLLHMAVVIAIGFAIGTLCYTVASKVSDMLLEKVHVRKVANVLYPWGKLHPDLEG
jgi:hypothetical protein